MTGAGSVTGIVAAAADGLATRTVVLGADPLGHVLDKDVVGSGPWALTMNTITLILGVFVFLGLMQLTAKAIATGPESEGNERYITKSRFGQVMEVIVIALRDMFIKPQLGKDTDKFLPFLLTLFFFIWTMNLIGLVPLIDIQYLIGYFALSPAEYSELKVVGGTPTGRLGTNAALALIAFLLWNANGIKENGLGGWLAHFTGGAPWFLWIILIPVEILGAIVKPAALTIRLFANMTAGHVLLAAVLGFTGMAVAGLGVLGAPIAVVALVGGVAIFFLEIFVATLQAFVFMFLATVFIAQLAHHEHDEHAHEHGEGESVPEGASLGAA